MHCEPQLLEVSGGLSIGCEYLKFRTAENKQTITKLPVHRPAHRPCFGLFREYFDKGYATLKSNREKHREVFSTQNTEAGAIWTTSYPEKSFEWVQKGKVGWKVSLLSVSGAFYTSRDLSDRSGHSSEHREVNLSQEMTGSLGQFTLVQGGWLYFTYALTGYEWLPSEEGWTDERRAGWSTELLFSSRALRYRDNDREGKTSVPLGNTVYPGFESEFALQRGCSSTCLVTLCRLRSAFSRLRLRRYSEER